MTVLPRGARPQDVIAFDNGPGGNMVIDAVVSEVTGGGCMDYDVDGGAIAARGAKW